MPVVTNHSDTWVEEILVPGPDGVQTEFQTSAIYRAGTLSLWINGVRVVAELDDGYLSPGGTLVTMKLAPWADDTLEARYDPV